jgi:hypothetical protein
VVAGYFAVRWFNRHGNGSETLHGGAGPSND